MYPQAGLAIMRPLNLTLDSTVPKERAAKATTSPFSASPFKRPSHFLNPDGVTGDSPYFSKVDAPTSDDKRLLDWLSLTLHHDYPSCDLRKLIQDGVIPCRALEATFPGALSHHGHDDQDISKSLNLPRFFRACQHLGFHAGPVAKIFDPEASHKRTYSLLLQLERASLPVRDQKVLKIKPPMSSQEQNDIGVVPKSPLQHLFLAPPIRPTEALKDDNPVPIVIPSSRSHADNVDTRPGFSRRTETNQPESARHMRKLSAHNSLKTKTNHGHSAAILTPPGSPLGMLPSSQRSSFEKSRLSTSAKRESITLDDSGTYVLGNTIGRGQFGTVYRAINTSTGSIVAIKRIPLQGRSSREIEAMMHEVNFLRELRSPNIVKYEGVVMSEEFLSIVIEYVENGSLLHTLRTFGPFREDLCASYTSRIIEGLIYLHSKDVVHCDIKCANVLSTKTGEVKLSDFGVSLCLSGQSTMKGEVNGTPNWLAPEVISLRGTSKASDIWSLGCTVLEMVTGRPPYSGQNTMSTMYSIVEDKCPPIPDHLSDRLTSFLLACFQKEPRSRPSASELLSHPWLLLHSQRTSLFDEASAPPQEIPEGVLLDGIRSAFSPVDVGVINGNQGQSKSHMRQASLPNIAVPGGQRNGVLLSSKARRLSAQQGRAIINVHDLIKAETKEQISCSICNSRIKQGSPCTCCKNCDRIAHARCFVELPVICNTSEVPGKRLSQAPLQFDIDPAKRRDSRNLHVDMRAFLHNAKEVLKGPHVCHPVVLKKKKTHKVLASSGECRVM